MPLIEIPEIYIPEIYIPEPYTPDVPVVTQYLEINPPGCTYGHRDIKNTGNHNLLLDDPNGVYTLCDFTFPSFIPPDYNPNQMTMIEEPLPQGGSPEIPKTEQPEIPKIPEDKPPTVTPCPSKKNQRVGDFRNEKRLERVIGHERGEDGIECITIYEDVPFKDQYIPEISTLISTVVIGLVAAGSPLLLNAVKPLVKQVVKKLTKKKKDKV